MLGRHMAFFGGIPIWPAIPLMKGNTNIIPIYFNIPVRIKHFDFLTGILIRNAVVMFVFTKINMMIKFHL